MQLTNAAILRAQYEHAIATLLGVPATSFSLPRRALLGDAAGDPAGTPSQLLERRPDIAAAERQMASANAAIGIGYAAYFPADHADRQRRVCSARAWTRCSTGRAGVWAVGADLAQTLFDGGRRRANVEPGDRRVQRERRELSPDRARRVPAGRGHSSRRRASSPRRSSSSRGRRARAEGGSSSRRTATRTGLDPYINVMTQQTSCSPRSRALVSFEIQQMPPPCCSCRRSAAAGIARSYRHRGRTRHADVDRPPRAAPPVHVHRAGDPDRARSACWRSAACRRTSSRASTSRSSASSGTTAVSTPQQMSERIVTDRPSAR